MKLVIERETWLRGEGDDNSYLLRKEDGKKCCLGFFALQCGLTPEQITNMRGPMSLVKAGIPLPEPMQFLIDNGWTGDDASEAMSTNDFGYGDDTDREMEIAKLFAKHDIQVEFV